ncbi:hypothetical protein [Acidovorax sp. SUPP2539]|uniref:hypothetical protein n=1 Tax=Acidovorax sp. SUPP2539 TaxID=2920878 RepID=UPI0023DE30B1|nr:hypothetical protein [Acidovorax sp. SUPP2539]GKS89096.1 hypothetical protein AVTE2539_07045 [Acidovorax sp. SUPP2539]
MPPVSTITAGARVTYQGDEYKVRSVDGNVLELAYDTGCFFRLVHVSSVTVCPTPATQTVASLPAPAAGQGEGTMPSKLGYLFCTHCDWSGFSDELEADRSIGYQGGLCPDCFSHCEEQPA